METLVQRILQGDEQASTELVRGYQEMVYRLAYLILGDADDAKDAAQEAFIRAFDALDRFDTSRPLRPWLLRIVANVARTQLQAKGRQMAALRRLAQSDPDQFVMPAPQISEAAFLWEAARKLDEGSQEVLYLRYFLDLSLEETAQALEVPTGTVKSRQARALERLRVIIQHKFPLEWEVRTR